MNGYGYSYLSCKLFGYAKLMFYRDLTYLNNYRWISKQMAILSTMLVLYSHIYILCQV
jgi:hypothetical protein